MITLVCHYYWLQVAFKGSTIITEIYILNHPSVTRNLFEPGQPKESTKG